MRARWVDRPWGRMRVWEGGLAPGESGPSLLAVHGLGGSGRYWQGLHDLAGDRFRIVAPDMAGFGGSGKPRGVAYDRALHLADLDAVALEDEGLRGSWWAIRWGVRWPRSGRAGVRGVSPASA